MRTSVFKIKSPYNKVEIKNSIGKIGTFKTGNTLITTYDGKKVCETDISDRYFDFDFSGFSFKVLNEIENYFKPEKYTLKITSGFQELRLMGEEITIDGEKYKKMFNLLNSTNREYALQMNIGLIRVSTGAGIVLSSSTVKSSMISRHFFVALPERVKDFVEKLKDFDIIIDSQTIMLKDLAKELVSFSEIVETLGSSTNPKTGNVSNSAKLRVASFGKQLLKSPMNRVKNLTAAQVKLLSNPMQTLKNNKVDVKVKASHALHAYTESYKNYNSCVQRTESARILKAMGK